MAEEYADERYEELMELIDGHPGVEALIQEAGFTSYRSHFNKVMEAVPNRNTFLQMRRSMLNEMNEKERQVVLIRGEVLRVVGLMPKTYDPVVISRVDGCYYAVPMSMCDYVPKPEKKIGGKKRSDK